MAIRNNINNKTEDITIDPGASGNAIFKYAAATVDFFATGVEDADDSYRIAPASTVGAGDIYITTSAGEITMPLQPAVLTDAHTEDANVTGDGTAYTVAFPDEIFDQNNDFATPTFTAPVDGRYHIQVELQVQNGATGGNVESVNIVTSNRTYYVRSLPCNEQLAGFLGPNAWIGITNTCFADMDATDTVTIAWTSTGGAKVDDVKRQSFRCLLVC